MKMIPNKIYKITTKDENFHIFRYVIFIEEVFTSTSADSLAILVVGVDNGLTWYIPHSSQWEFEPISALEEVLL